MANFPALKCRTVSPSNLHLSAVPRYEGSFGLVEPFRGADFPDASEAEIFCLAGEVARPKFPVFVDDDDDAEQVLVSENPVPVVDAENVFAATFVVDVDADDVDDVITPPLFESTFDELDVDAAVETFLPKNEMDYF